MNLEVFISLRKKKKIKKKIKTGALGDCRCCRITDQLPWGVQYPDLTALWEGSCFYGYAHHSKTHSVIRDEPLGAHCCPAEAGGVGGATSSAAPCPLSQPMAISC